MPARDPSQRAIDDLTQRARFVTAVSRGMADAFAGRVHTHEEVKRRMKARFCGTTR